MINSGKYLELSKVSVPIPFCHSKMQIFESHYESYISKYVQKLMLIEFNQFCKLVTCFVRGNLHHYISTYSPSWNIMLTTLVTTNFETTTYVLTYLWILNYSWRKTIINKEVSQNIHENSYSQFRNWLLLPVIMIDNIRTVIRLQLILS